MSNESDNLYAPTFDEVRSLQDLYFGSSKSHYLSKEEEKNKKSKYRERRKKSI